MTINNATRWRLVGAAEVSCRDCYAKPVYRCERCERLFCLAHLRLVEWRVYEIALADADGAEAQTVKVAHAQTSPTRVNVHHLVCHYCAHDLAQFG